MGAGKFIDKIKVNKFSGLVWAVGGYELYRFIDGTKDVDEAVIRGALGAVIMLWSIPILKRQNYYYDRLVNKISEGGYDERFCLPHMNSLCGRSLVKTALKRTKNFDKYTQLKEKSSLTTILVKNN